MTNLLRCAGRSVLLRRLGLRCLRDGPVSVRLTCPVRQRRGLFLPAQGDCSGFESLKRQVLGFAQIDDGRPTLPLAVGFPVATAAFAAALFLAGCETTLLPLKSKAADRLQPAIPAGHANLHLYGGSLFVIDQRIPVHASRGLFHRVTCMGRVTSTSHRASIPNFPPQNNGYRLMEIRARFLLTPHSPSVAPRSPVCLPDRNLPSRTPAIQRVYVTFSRTPFVTCNVFACRWDYSVKSWDFPLPVSI